MEGRQPVAGRSTPSATTAAVRARLAGISPAFRDALIVAAGSRMLVWLVAILSAKVLGARSEINASLNDDPALTAAAGSVGRVLLTPLAHWDSAWYLGIAGHGYAPIRGLGLVRAAFFPLYPLLVWVGSGFGSTAGARLVAAFVVSLAAFTGALYLLHRLTALEMGEKYALPCLALIALFPGALFFGIPYSEAVFLLVSVGAFYAARTASSGALGALASATRSAGTLLLVPLLLLYLYGPRPDRPAAPPNQAARRLLPSRFAPRYPLQRDVLWLALAPLGIVAYSVYLQLAHHDALAWSHVEADWGRHFAGPFAAVATGASQAWRGLHALITGSTHSVYLQHGYLEPTRAAVVDVALFVFLFAAVVALVGAFRRLPLAYGAWVLVALVLPLSYPAAGQALESLPRYLAVLFPLFMWLAGWSRDRRAVEPVAGIFTLLLAVFAAQFAAWEFVS